MTFDEKFPWFLIQYRLFRTAFDNMLTWEGAALIGSFMADYAIDFAAILWYKIYHRVFREVKNFLYHCLIQRLCDEAIVPKITGVDWRVLVIATA